MEILEILEKLSEKIDVKFECINGEIVPKESSEPLSKEVLDFILSDDFDIEKLLTFYDMPKTSINHRRIISNLNDIFATELARSIFSVYINDMCISTKWLGAFYIPDITFTLRTTESYNTDGALENPTSIIEVLSPSTEKKDRKEKKEAYQSIESLQEYVLIAQDCYKIEQYLREGKTKWTVKIYDSENDTCVLTVGVKIKLNELYKNTDWKK